MSVEDAMAKYGPSEITTDDLLTVPDPAFTAENVALVTGAGNGIGRAIALGLAANGLTVVGVDVDEDGLAEVEDTADDLELDGRFLGSEGDLTDDDAMRAVVDAAAEEGSIRYLANVAGVQHIDAIPDFPMEQYDFMHDLMLRAPLLLTKLCWPHFEASGGGVVCNMASVHGHYVTRDKVAYNATKFGLRGLTQSIAAEGEGSIRAFSVSPAYVKTELVAKQLPDTADARGLTVDEAVTQVLLEQARTKEMLEPYEVANACTFGLSKHAHALNAGDLLLDGGYTLTYE
ncbi:SDR family NAD(P)-dependent oxidoreductase [Halomarina oriensis]|uniref:SDR family oxidoreductase n=1 Tax=Halomarina oriensis TaxID=671145 RepID=A0A6B0GIY8_9EURY|nr:SDR family NAD(P)-dependent oxidoreductase [Halomarina oriensis]MWG34846.1 SDR family oxidoreductase [Halomarina oriensis]